MSVITCSAHRNSESHQRRSHRGISQRKREDTHRQSAHEDQQQPDKLVPVVHEERMTAPRYNMRLRVAEVPPELARDCGPIHERVLRAQERQQWQSVPPQLEQPCWVVRAQEHLRSNFCVLRDTPPQPGRLYRVWYSRSRSSDEPVDELRLGPPGGCGIVGSGQRLRDPEHPRGDELRHRWSQEQQRRDVDNPGYRERVDVGADVGYDRGC